MHIYSANEGKVAELNIETLKVENELQGLQMESGDISTSHIIGGKDDRRVFLDSNYPWHLVGYLDYSAGHNGSGVLIGKKLVLTCYHCIDFDTGNFIKDFHFVPAKYSNPPSGSFEEPMGRFKVKNAYWFGNGRPTDGDNSYGSMDFAILELENETGLGYAGSRKFHKDWIGKEDWFHIGYPGGNAHGLNNLIQGKPTFQQNIKVMDYREYNYRDYDGKNWQGQKVFTNADIEPGQSGGPLFKIENNGLLVSGVLGGAGTTDTGGAACGDLMNALIRWCRTNIDK